MPDKLINPSPLASFFSRHWWLVLIPAAFAFYLVVVSLLTEIGKASDTDSNTNIFFESALTLAPWHSDAAASYATNLRAYAVSIPSGEERQATMERVLALYEQAMQGRPLWPYYHLGAFDAEYLLGSPADVIQTRFNRIITLAPNERGLDRNLLELSLYSWDKLKTDQQQWVINRLQKTQHAIRRDMLTVIRDLKPYQPGLCIQMPWTLVKRVCRD